MKVPVAPHPTAGEQVGIQRDPLRNPQGERLDQRDVVVGVWRVVECAKPVSGGVVRGGFIGGGFAGYPPNSRLMEVLLDHPLARDTQWQSLHTRDAMGFYERLGFTTFTPPGWRVEMKRLA